ncbi:MAG: class I fructose-bisphosphate aldolase, partial [Thermogladius sp.]
SGGPARENFLDFLRDVESVMRAGASGVVVGRNVFRHPHPEKAVKAIAAVVHEGRTAEEAFELVK